MSVSIAPAFAFGFGEAGSLAPLAPFAPLAPTAKPPRTLAVTYHGTRMGQALFDLSGKTAVVAGGTSGIGRTLAMGLADAGADVVVVGRREDAVYEAATEIEHRGRRTLRLTADVTDRASLERVRDACLKQLGDVHILVVAAGVTAKMPTLDMDETAWQHILDTNLTGTLLACQVFGAAMVARRGGRIINVASLSSFLGFLRSRRLYGKQSRRCRADACSCR